MKIQPKRFLLQMIAALSVLVALACYSEQAPDIVKKVIPTLETWGHSPALVAAVKAQNSQNLTLDQIKARDKKWRATSSVDSFMNSLMHNDAAKQMLKFEKSKPYFAELFLMDNQGANVAMTNKTSDYWQGDEAKFTQTYKQGKGAVHVSDVEYDDSTLSYLVQVSVPVIDHHKKVIGALTIGINLDELEGH
ncbi:MAG: hypothetical protein CENE_02930 [Candidatus Celerinatantimonas neptuna]|nr:MAG: hypothetical protein CENE_02930 [Candidatus Celerinatantimonas neptuna]